MRRKKRKLAVSRETMREISGLDRAAGQALRSNTNCGNNLCGTQKSDCPSQCPGCPSYYYNCAGGFAG